MTYKSKEQEEKEIQKMAEYWKKQGRYFKSLVKKNVILKEGGNVYNYKKMNEENNRAIQELKERGHENKNTQKKYNLNK